MRKFVIRENYDNTREEIFYSLYEIKDFKRSLRDTGSSRTEIFDRMIMSVGTDTEFSLVFETEL